MLENKFEEFFKYTFNENTYKDQLIISYQNKLYDFSVILLWKIFIIFSYEKISQYRKVKGDVEFERILKSAGGMEKESVDKYDLGNIYAYNKIEDNKLINLLSRIYLVDENFFKKLRHLKNIRDTASHVSDLILATTDESLESFLDDLTKIIKRINDFHSEKFIFSYDYELCKNLELSRIDKSLLLDELIKKLAVVISFDGAASVMRKILDFKEIIIEANINKILEKSSENINGTINQVLCNNFSIKFIQNLLALSYERDYDLDTWKLFYNGLDNTLRERFGDIRISLKKRGVKGILNPEGVFDIEDVPF
jgi:hypothetical protein